MMMAPGNDRDPAPGKRRGASDDGLDERLRDLKSRVGERTGALEAASRKEANPTSWTVAFRYGTEFAGGVLVGAVIGWGIDQIAGTSPWGMIVFLLLGFAAGMLNVIRAANSVGSAAAKAGKKD